MAETIVSVVVKALGGNKLDNLKKKLGATKDSVSELQEAIKRQGAANSLLKQKLTALTSTYSKVQAQQKKLASTPATNPKAKFQLEQQTQKLEELKQEIDRTKASLRQGLTLNIQGKRNLDILQQELRETQAELDKTATTANKIKGGFEIAGNAVNGFAKRVGGLRSQLLGLGVGAGLAKSFGDASALESTEARAGLLVKRFEQLDGIQKVAAQSAEKFRLTQTNTLTDLVDLGSRLGATGTSLEDIQTIYEGFNTLLAVNKVEAAQAASAQLQLNQALGAGVLNGEEFNAINDATPQLLDAVAKKLNVQRGELKKLASEGKITREVLIAAFADINKSASGDLEGTFTGAFGATREFNAALQEFSTIVGQELLPVITPLIQGATQLLKAFGELPGPAKTAAVGITAIGTAAIFAAPAIAAVTKSAIGLFAALGTAKLGAAAAGVTKLALAFTGLKTAIAILTGPVGLLVAGVTAVGVGAVVATKKINDFNNEINKTTTTSAETANQIQLVEGRLQKLQGELAGSGNSARGLKRQVEELKARLEELKGTYKVQIEIETIVNQANAATRRETIQGFDTLTEAQIAEARRLAGLDKPLNLGGGSSSGGGGGGGKGGVGAALQDDTDQAKELSRQLSQQIQLLKEAEGLDRDRVANFFEQENQLKRISELQNISSALRSQLETQTKELGALRDTELVLDSVFQKTGEITQQAFDALTPLQQQGQLLEARLNGTEKEAALQIQIANAIRGLPPELAKLVEEQIRYNAALEDAVAKQAELDSLYQGIGDTIENGIIGAIDAGIEGLINGTKDLGKALQEIAAGVLKDIGRQLISFGVRGALQSTKLPFFAEGGRPKPGKPAIVGEKGPELFIPDSAGTVIPNDISKQLISFGLKGLPKSVDLPFFAEGGRPKPGKPAIVGEKGPELFIPDSAGTVISNDVSKQLTNFDTKGLLQPTDLQFFADGGRPEVGKPAIVGEKGPELFIPDTAGTIVPNDEAFSDARNALIDTPARPANEESEAFAVAAGALERNSQIINNRQTTTQQETSFNSFTEAMMRPGQSTVRFETVNVGDMPMVTREEALRIGAESAKAAEANVFSALRNKPAVRRSIGMI